MLQKSQETSRIACLLVGFHLLLPQGPDLCRVPFGQVPVQPHPSYLPTSQLLASVLCQEAVVCTHSRAVVLAPCLGLCHLLSALIWQLAGGIR